jgi:ribosomal protein S21
MPDIHVEVKYRDLNPDHYPDLSKKELDDLAFDKMMKRFSRKVIKCGVMDRYRKHQYFVKPSLEKHLKTNDWKYRKEHGLLDCQKGERVKKEVI